MTNCLLTCVIFFSIIVCFALKGRDLRMDRWIRNISPIAKRQSKISACIKIIYSIFRLIVPSVNWGSSFIGPKCSSPDVSQLTEIQGMWYRVIEKSQLCWINKQAIGCDYARASPSVVFQQSKGKDEFFRSSASVRCRTLRGKSYLLNLPKWVQSCISRFTCDKQINNVSSGETFPWRRIEIVSVDHTTRRQFWRYPPNFVVLSTEDTEKMFTSVWRMFVRKCVRKVTKTLEHPRRVHAMRIQRTWQGKTTSALQIVYR